jgi:hypothetical protein
MHASPSQSPWEFLIVSALERVHKMLAAAIQDGGGVCHHTMDTTSAMAYIARRKLDGICIDTQIEGAFNLVGSIRRGNSNRFSAIFACVGEDQDVARLLNAGVNFVVVKPPNPQELPAVLKAAIPMMTAERQRYQRHAIALPVVVKTPEKEHLAMTANISRGGMAVRCAEFLAPGSAIQFVLELPERAEPVRGRGEVAWAKPEGMMGIRFYLVGEEAKKALWHWMEHRADA